MPWRLRPFEHEGDERPVHERDDRLGHGRGERAQARALAPDQDHGLHRPAARAVAPARARLSSLRSPRFPPCPRIREHGRPARAGLRSPPDAFVREPCGPHRLGVESVATVDQDVAAHGSCDLVPVELAELGPLGHEHHGVGALHRVERRPGRELRHQLARLVLGHRVIRAHLGALGEQPRCKHQRGGSAHVVGLRLERQAEQADAPARELAQVALELRRPRAAFAAR